MKTAKLFISGGSQAVRLPAYCRFKGKEVFISKKGDQVILSPKPESWAEFLSSGPRVSPDFMQGFKDLPVQNREDL
jgi:antitoxin VapB